MLSCPGWPRLMPRLPHRALERSLQFARFVGSEQECLAIVLADHDGISSRDVVQPAAPRAVHAPAFPERRASGLDARNGVQRNLLSRPTEPELPAQESVADAD